MGRLAEEGRAEPGVVRDDDRVCALRERVPGCKGCKPRGRSRRTRKWPVNGGPKALGRVSASICVQLQAKVSQSSHTSVTRPKADPTW